MQLALLFLQLCSSLSVTLRALLSSLEIMKQRTMIT